MTTLGKCKGKVYSGISPRRHAASSKMRMMTAISGPDTMTGWRTKSRSGIRGLSYSFCCDLRTPCSKAGFSVAKILDDLMERLPC